MRIGFLLPTVLASETYAPGRIFAPKNVALPLVDGLVAEGHEVFLYTAGDVKTKAHLIAGEEEYLKSKPEYFQFRYREEAEKKYTTTEIIKRDFEYYLTMKAYQDASDGKLDIIHSFHDFGAHYFNELTKFPTVYTLHDPLPQHTNTIEYLRYSKFKKHHYITISNSQRRSIIDLNFAATIYHGLNLDEYEFAEHPDNYLIYFGRLLEDKAPHLAIQVAKELHIPLHIATSVDKANKTAGYFEEKIEPFIDNKEVIMTGYLQGKEKSDWIRKAKAFVFPLQWEEPFGLTIIEAMACGTPVVAFNHGSVHELVKDGVTGYVVDPREGVEGLKKAVQKIDKIDRRSCRKWVEGNFTIQKMINNYIHVYRRILS